MFQPHSCWLIRSPCLWWQEVPFGTTQKGSLGRAVTPKRGFWQGFIPSLRGAKTVFFENLYQASHLARYRTFTEHDTCMFYSTGKRHLQHSHQIEKDLKTIATQIKLTNSNSKNIRLAVQMILGAPELKEIATGRQRIWKAAANHPGAPCATFSGHEKHRGKYKCIPSITRISTYTCMYL